MTKEEIVQILREKYCFYYGKADPAVYLVLINILETIGESHDLPM